MSSVHDVKGRGALHGIALAMSLVGASFVLGTVVILNQFSEAPKQKDVQEGTAIQVQAAPKPKPKKKVEKPRPKPKSKPRTPPPPSLAALTSGVGNFSIDLPGFDMNDVGGAAGDLLGGNDDVTHTSDTVDDPPVPTAQGDLRYPPQLRQRGVQGYVLISMLVGANGAVQDVRVIESQPADTFDVYATEFVRSWRFQPGRYKGEAVSTWVEQKVTFSLGS